MNVNSCVNVHCLFCVCISVACNACDACEENLGYVCVSVLSDVHRSEVG